MRRAAYLRQALAEEPAALLVDTGGTLLGGADAASQRTDELLVRALAAMRYDALNAGSGELRAGPGALRYLADPGAPALISSNGRPAGGAQTAPPRPYLIREVAGVRVGLVGVTSPEASGAASVAPAIQALRSLLPEVRRQADVIVVLADLEAAGVQELVAAGLDVQIVLGSRGLPSDAPTQVGQTLVLAVGGDGRYVGKLTFELSARGQVDSAQSSLVLLDQSAAADPGVAAILAEYQ